jgi:hypothetical protein
MGILFSLADPLDAGIGTGLICPLGRAVLREPRIGWPRVSLAKFHL